MKEADQIKVNAMSVIVDCPNCGYENEGWFSDLRGCETECEGCGENFTITENADIVIS